MRNVQSLRMTGEREREREDPAGIDDLGAKGETYE